MFDYINFEISGICNGKCPYCATGASNISKKNIKNNYKFIEVEKFEKAIDYILDNKMFNPESGFIALYNWGEPFLHPNFESIVGILNCRDIKFQISTNASKIPKISSATSMKNLKSLNFSMSGFSQHSYDKIHGFNFESIKKNIIEIIKTFRDLDYKGIATIFYHVYQFNIGEYKGAFNFAKANNINIYPYYAGFNNYENTKKYLNNELSYDFLKKVSKDLMLFYVDELLFKKPSDYRCTQFDVLLIDEECNTLTCCALPKGNQSYSFGNLFSLSLKEIYELKTNQKECINCQKLHFDYWVGNIQPAKFLISSLNANEIKVPEAFNKLFMSNKQFEKAWDALCLIYSKRSDLMQAFPLNFVQDVNFHFSLLMWAVKVSTGIINDSDGSKLENFAGFYKEMLNIIIN